MNPKKKDNESRDYPKKKDNESRDSKEQQLPISKKTEPFPMDFLSILNPMMQGIGSKAGVMAGLAILGQAIDRLTAALLTSAYIPQPWYLPSEVLEFYKGFLKGVSPQEEEGEPD